MLVSPRCHGRPAAPRYLVAPLLRSDSRAARLASASGFFSGARSRSFRGSHRVSQGSWGIFSHAPHSLTPADARRQAIATTSLLPSALCTAWARQHTRFRGSIARLTRPLSTLRSRGLPRSTQDSLPGGGHPSPGGVLTRVIPSVGFRDAVCFTSSLSPPPGFLLAQACPC